MFQFEISLACKGLLLCGLLLCGLLLCAPSLADDLCFLSMFLLPFGFLVSPFLFAVLFVAIYFFRKLLWLVKVAINY